MSTPEALQTREPTPGDDFVWVDQPWGRVLRANALGRAADHFFTARQLRLRAARGQEAPDWALVARAIGVDEANLARARQVHGTSVLVVRVGMDFGAPNGSAADILVTNDLSRALTVRVADCVPVLLADPVSGAVAAAHAGWRGTAAGAVSVAVGALARTYGSRPADLLVAVGPSIGPCCYEVGREVLDAFQRQQSHAARWFSPRPHGRFHLDLWQATRDQLQQSGVAPEHISIARLCTATHRDWFFSYRVEGEATGRLVAVIRPRERAVFAPAQ